MFAAHVARLRDLLRLNDQMTEAAANIRRDMKAPKDVGPSEFEMNLPLQG